MVHCFVPECNCNNKRTRCSFFRFPLKDDFLLKKWLKNIRRADAVPSPSSRICSCHFLNNNPKASEGPTIFSWNTDKLMKVNFVSPKKCVKQRRSCRKRTRSSVTTKKRLSNVDPGSSAEQNSTETNAVTTESAVQPSNIIEDIALTDNINDCSSSSMFEENTNETRFADTENRSQASCTIEHCTSEVQTTERSSIPDQQMTETSSTPERSAPDWGSASSNCTTDPEALKSIIINLQAENYALIKKNDDLKNCYLSKLLKKSKDKICHLKIENKELREEYDKLKKSGSVTRLEKLEDKIVKLEKERDELRSRVTFGIHRLTKDEMMIHYTGVSLEAFKIIVQLSENVKFKYLLGFQPSTVSFENQILLTLMKLRLNPTNIDLGIRFGISETSVSNIFRTLLTVLHTCLYKILMNKIPSQSKNTLSLPSSFKPFYQNCRAIFDCTEFPCEKPSNMEEQKMMYSNYKHCHTLKVLVVIAPNGVVTRVSNAYPGSTSDKAIVENCQILKDLKPGDLILADKGFLLNELVPPDISVNIPPFLCSPQFTHSEVDETRRIAKARIHVERAFGRIKCFRIVRFFTRKMYPIASEIIQLCAALTNFRNPLIKEVGHLYSATEGYEVHSVSCENDIDDPDPVEDESDPVEEIVIDIDEFLFDN